VGLRLSQDSDDHYRSAAPQRGELFCIA